MMLCKDWLIFGRNPQNSIESMLNADIIILIWASSFVFLATIKWECPIVQFAFTHWLPDDTEAIFPEKKS